MTLSLVAAPVGSSRASAASGLSECWVASNRVRVGAGAQVQPGRDPVHDFMSFRDDPCLDRFSRGQSLRMALTWFTSRPDAILLP